MAALNDGKKDQADAGSAPIVPELLSGPSSRRLADLYDESDVVDAVYRAKAHAVNDAMQEIGMGRYQVRAIAPDYSTSLIVCLSPSQWGLWAVCGFGYFSDSVWPVRCGSYPCIHSADSWQLLSGLILSPAISEFEFKSPFLSLALNVGLTVGAIFWGVGSDFWGRKFGSRSSPPVMILTSRDAGTPSTLPSSSRGSSVSALERLQTLSHWPLCSPSWALVWEATCRSMRPSS
jgi:hypothetical protein